MVGAAVELSVAKKTTTLRVHQLAKQIGVTSKDIVSKCKAEEIPGITNHMSAVSLGLAATIREWFGSEEGGVATAVQAAPPVDVASARERARKAAKKATKKKAARKKVTRTVTQEPAAPAAPAEPAEPAAPAEPVAPAVAPPDGALAPAATAPVEPLPEAPVIETPGAGDIISPAAAAEVPAGAGEPIAVPDEAGKPIMNVPQRPDVIAPAGRKLEKPVKTKLAGPKVIRVEAPETIPAPRPRTTGPDQPGRGGPWAGRGAGPAMPPESGGGAARGGRGGGRATSGRNKRRSASAQDSGRSGRSSLTPSSGERPFNWREQDLLEREKRLNRAGGFFRAARRDNLKRTAGAGKRATTLAETGGTVKVNEPLTIKNLSAATGIKQNDIVRQLVQAGMMVTTFDAQLDADMVTEVMSEFGINLEVTEQKSAEEQIVEQFKEREYVDKRPRSPVVTILGHVDHGKTTLLDNIRNANVAEGEAGGITQATSAFRVPVKVGDDERRITFIDTPGHEAFTSMRARGAKVTDIVVLVVAADDGVMPQTVESINHSKAANVPIVVALNKIDKPEATDANIQRILGELAENGLNPVDWGGQTEVIRISAIKGEGIQDLLDVLDYQSQLLELAADFGGPAEGTVLEAQIEEGRGAVARVLVQEGSLRKGDFVVAGRAFGRVRDIVDDRGQRSDEAGPSTPVAFSGIDKVPDAGDKFYAVKNLRAAEAAAGERRDQQRQRDLSTEKVTLDNIFEKLAEGERKQLPLIVKADVQGSVETLKSTLEKISGDEVTISIKHTAVGGINDSDILLAETTGAIIIGFNVTTTGKAKRLAEDKGIDIRLYDVIYDITDDVKKAAEGLLEPEYKLEVLGHADVREVFKITKVGMIAGCYVTDGSIERNAQIRVTRDGIVIEKDRRLEQLKRFKEDVKEVRAGQECGMRIDGYDDIRVGDVLECYKTLEVRRTL
jgi:translation initiation factor IF-2